ncbi:MAG TPA: stage II sporulation protein M, partial [Rhodocyclaceae bacterium]|nr:stage II sporulation protein M [Rhodocyclaceae bacterium]
AEAKATRLEALPFARLPGAFRRLCRDLALARDRQYSARLVEDLHRRVLAAHQHIYGAMPAQRGSVLAFIAGGFPRLVRDEWRLVLAAFLLFFLPLVIMLVAAQYVPESVYLILSPEQADQMQEMYAPDAKHIGRPRSAGSQWEMWGYYIANNVRIDFQCFAGGIAFGVGAVFFMIYNGLMIGAVAGHLTQLGYIETFWGFVAGHGAFELTGAVLAGAAGLKLGQALIAPGRKGRMAALKDSATVAVRLLYGAATLTFLAAFIEAFWSPTQGIPVQIKYGVGIALWVLTLAYLLLAGRRPRAA